MTAHSPSASALSPDPAPRVWCLLRDQIGHVKPVEDHFEGAAEFVYDAAWNAHEMLERRPDVVVCVNDFPHELAQCLDAARQAGIPTLTFQDGILEWRCQYENPLFGAGGGAPQHQPVLADKIACLGAASARHIAAWGNAERVEVVGMPKLDAFLSRDIPAPRRPGKRLLVMTAKKPWYDEAQRAVIERSLSDLKAHLDGHPEIEVVWRLTRGLAETVRVVNRLGSLETAELSHVLSEVDAVVSTPSTAILEAMVAGRPVAALDYPNVPRFVATAWTLSAPEHRESVVAELLDPPAAKMLFQNECLSDNLQCGEPAAPRAARLIQAMARLGRDARRQSSALRLPANLVGFQEPFGSSEVPPLRALYPGHPAFATDDVTALQVRLARLEKDYRRLRAGSRSARAARWLRQALRPTKSPR